MNIKVDRKYGENDRFLENVIIHRKSKTNINNTVIKAKTGELISSEESNILQLVLRDGHYYEDLKPKSSKDRKKHPFAKSNFEIYTINLDLSDLNDVDMDAESDISTDKMKNISRLSKDIDSLNRDNIKIVNSFSKNISNRIGAFVPVTPKDTIESETKGVIVKETLIKAKTKDTIIKKLDNGELVENIVELYPAWQQMQLMNAAKNTTASILTTISGKKKELSKRYKIYNMHILSLHKKFALAFACVILFFIGAPLGAIIRKGGLGLPMVIAIIGFLIYYFIGVFAGNYAKEGNIHPIFGAWMSTIIMLPLSIFLTKRATADRGLTNMGNIIDYLKGLIKKVRENHAT